MTVTVLDRAPELSNQTRLGYVDCDIHPYVRSSADLDPFLSERWRKHRVTVGARARQALSNSPQYFRLSPGTGMRRDAWPADGSHPGSDLAMMREQLLDAFGAAHGIMLPLIARCSDERNVEYGAALCTAVNDWQAHVWSDPEPRLKGWVQVAV